MEVGIRKGAWRRAWRYPAYLWSLRWVYAVKKIPEVGVRRTAYTPAIHHCVFPSRPRPTRTRTRTVLRTLSALRHPVPSWHSVMHAWRHFVPFRSASARLGLAALSGCLMRRDSTSDCKVGATPYSAGPSRHGRAPDGHDVPTFAPPRTPASPGNYRRIICPTGCS